jgi:hypothetical protein
MTLLIINPADNSVAAEYPSGVERQPPCQPASWVRLTVCAATRLNMLQHLLPDGRLQDPRVNGLLTWDDIRLVRNALVAECTWTQAATNPPARIAAWAAYIKELLDITKSGTPATVAWPTPPAPDWAPQPAA